MDQINKIFDLHSIEREFQENDKRRGNLAELSEGRLVFIGEKPENREEWYIAFRNAKGDGTRLGLSKDAMATLVQLYKRVQPVWLQLTPS